MPDSLFRFSILSFRYSFRIFRQKNPLSAIRYQRGRLLGTQECEPYCLTGGVGGFVGQAHMLAAVKTKRHFPHRNACIARAQIEETPRLPCVKGAVMRNASLRDCRTKQNCSFSCFNRKKRLPLGEAVEEQCDETDEGKLFLFLLAVGDIRHRPFPSSVSLTADSFPQGKPFLVSSARRLKYSTAMPTL